MIRNIPWSAPSLFADFPWRSPSGGGFFVKTIQETPFPLAERRLAGSVEARLPSVGSASARSDPSGAGGSEARRAPLLHLLACSADVRRVPKGALLQRRRNSLKFGLAQWEGSGIILTCALKRTVFLGSSTAEHPAVNRRVVGSNPTRGAIEHQISLRFRGLIFILGSSSRFGSAFGGLALPALARRATQRG